MFCNVRKDTERGTLIMKVHKTRLILRRGHFYSLKGIAISFWHLEWSVLSRKIRIFSKVFFIITFKIISSIRRNMVKFLKVKGWVVGIRDIFIVRGIQCQILRHPEGHLCLSPNLLKVWNFLNDGLQTKWFQNFFFETLLYNTLL